MSIDALKAGVTPPNARQAPDRAPVSEANLAVGGRDGSAGAAGRARALPADKAKLDAARKFEALLVQQLMQVMRNTAKNGGMMSSSGASGQYLSMFDEMVSEKMAEGGGIGLSSTLMQAMGGEPDAAAAPMVTTSLQRGTPAALPHVHGGISAPLPTLQGATARLAQAAYAISARDGGKQWAKAGTLLPADLASQAEVQTAEGAARFNVLDAQGYQDSYKCNLFALEAARRAGFEVPVVARPRGLGFPTSETVTNDAQDGSLRGDWAEVVSPAQMGELPDKLARGELAVMLTGSGMEGRHGHMAVVERIHHVELDRDGSVKRIEFDGYEARVDGAQHLQRRSWNRYGAGDDDPGARNGFGRIEILALKPSHSPEKPEVLVSSGARASLKDFSSRSP